METKTIYLAGELFDFKHLIGNAVLGEKISRVSEGHYESILPQSLEQRETTAEAIRNQDIKALLEADTAVFHFDGTELDSGTVVEFMIAKFADIPSVVVRGDFRAGGDSQSYPWNLMAAFYPRTKVLVEDSLGLYQKKLIALRSAGEVESTAAVKASEEAIEEFAAQVVHALDEVCSEKPVLAGDLLSSVYAWLSEFPGAGFSEILNREAIGALLKSKQSKKLI